MPEPQSGRRLSLGRRASAAEKIKNRKLHATGIGGAGWVWVTHPPKTKPPGAVAWCWRRGGAA